MLKFIGLKLLNIKECSVLIQRMCVYDAKSNSENLERSVWAFSLYSYAFCTTLTLHCNDIKLKK